MSAAWSSGITGYFCSTRCRMQLDGDQDQPVLGTAVNAYIKPLQLLDEFRGVINRGLLSLQRGDLVTDGLRQWGKRTGHEAAFLTWKCSSEAPKRQRATRTTADSMSVISGPC